MNTKGYESVESKVTLKLGKHNEHVIYTWRFVGDGLQAYYIGNRNHPIVNPLVSSFSSEEELLENWVASVAKIYGYSPLRLARAKFRIQPANGNNV